LENVSTVHHSLELARYVDALLVGPRYLNLHEIMEMSEDYSCAKGMANNSSTDRA
jgi:hypothetical protein